MRLLNENDVYALFAQNGIARLHVADIDALPRVDAKEVVHGWWNRRKSSHSQTGFVDQCSVCQFALVHLGCKTNYCPNCGAKMDSEG